MQAETPMLAMGRLEGSSDSPTIFATYGTGVHTNHDAWAYAFYDEHLWDQVRTFIAAHPEQRLRYNPKPTRLALYRPFTRKHLYLAAGLVDEPGSAAAFFASLLASAENNAICLPTPGVDIPFFALMTNVVPDRHLAGAGTEVLCFPFYTYPAEDGPRQENITDWALAEVHRYYGDSSIRKWDLFYYTYALLHHPDYRRRYAEDLTRALPRIPLGPGAAFRACVAAGQRLSYFHREYLSVTPYPLTHRQTTGHRRSWLVGDQGMHLSDDQTALWINASLTLGDLPPAVAEYRIGPRSALEWVIDQYRVRTDAESGREIDPNDEEEPQRIVELVERVVRVAVETVATIGQLPALA